MDKPKERCLSWLYRQLYGAEQLCVGTIAAWPDLKTRIDEALDAVRVAMSHVEEARIECREEEAA